MIGEPFDGRHKAQLVQNRRAQLDGEAARVVQELPQQIEHGLKNGFRSGRNRVPHPRELDLAQGKLLADAVVNFDRNAASLAQGYRVPGAPRQGNPECGVGFLVPPEGAGGLPWGADGVAGVLQAHSSNATHLGGHLQDQLFQQPRVVEA